MDKNTSVHEELSRRNFLFDTGKIIAGAAGIAAFAAGSEGLVSLAQAKSSSTGKWPWPYVKLDPQKTADIAYEEWYRVFCGAAVINSVFSQLRKKVGEPYKSFPSDAFVFLEGGMVAGAPSAAPTQAPMWSATSSSAPASPDQNPSTAIPSVRI